jgi:hypothetical protein
MKVYRIKQETMDVYQEPNRLEDFQPEHHTHLGDYDGYSYYSYDSEFVTLNENDEKYEQKEYDPTNTADKAELDSVKNHLHFLRQQIITKKAQLFETIDMFDVIAGIVEQDKYILDKVNEVKSQVDAIYSNYGF